MPIPTPLHPSTARHCVTQEWQDWAGYLAAATYQPSYEREYYAIRNSAALIDVSPLFKYDIYGSDAIRLMERLLPRAVHTCQVGQVLYSPWCNDDGKVIDDGIIQRLDRNHFRLTAAESSLFWLQDCGFGMDINVEDISESLAAVALQGPNARAILEDVTEGAELAGLNYYFLTKARVADVDVIVSRTGYTGDLGYELWVEAGNAPRLWDALIDSGRDYGLVPVGLSALDITRIEAGLLLIGVDYISAHKALIDSQLSSPFEIGLGWTVDLEKGDFIGRQALLAEKRSGSPWKFVGLEVSWQDLERLFGEVDLPPQLAGRASRSPIPIFKNGRQIGHITSRTFSPILKKYIGLGMVERTFSAIGTEVTVEIQVEYRRKSAMATIAKTPFFNPSRRKA